MEGIPMPVDDEYPPDPDGIDDPVNIVQTPPPSPPPDFDQVCKEGTSAPALLIPCPQGKLASSIIDESNARYLANLKNANTSGTKN
eukprot:375376-Hanusia_phi.AAC.1